MGETAEWKAQLELWRENPREGKSFVEELESVRGLLQNTLGIIQSSNPQELATLHSKLPSLVNFCAAVPVLASDYPSALLLMGCFVKYAISYVKQQQSKDPVDRMAMRAGEWGWRLVRHVRQAHLAKLPPMARLLGVQPRVFGNRLMKVRMQILSSFLEYLTLCPSTRGDGWIEWISRELSPLLSSPHVDVRTCALESGQTQRAISRLHVRRLDQLQLLENNLASYWGVSPSAWTLSVLQFLGNVRQHPWRSADPPSPMHRAMVRNPGMGTRAWMITSWMVARSGGVVCWVMRASRALFGDLYKGEDSALSVQAAAMGRCLARDDVAGVVDTLEASRPRSEDVLQCWMMLRCRGVGLLYDVLHRCLEGREEEKDANLVAWWVSPRWHGSSSGSSWDTVLAWVRAGLPCSSFPHPELEAHWELVTRGKKNLAVHVWLPFIVDLALERKQGKWVEQVGAYLGDEAREEIRQRFLLH